MASFARVGFLVTVLMAPPALGQILNPSGTATGGSASGGGAASTTSTTASSSTGSGSTSTSTGGSSAGGSSGASRTGSSVTSGASTGTVAPRAGTASTTSVTPTGNWLVCPASSGVPSDIEAAILGGQLTCAP
jgi:hypothetical protein